MLYKRPKGLDAHLDPNVPQHNVYVQLISICLVASGKKPFETFWPICSHVKETNKKIHKKASVLKNIKNQFRDIYDFCKMWCRSLR